MIAVIALAFAAAVVVLGFEHRGLDRFSGRNDDASNRGA